MEGPSLVMSPSGARPVPLRMTGLLTDCVQMQRCHMKLGRPFAHYGQERAPSLEDGHERIPG